MAHYDLVIVGTGSGNSIPGPEFDHWRIAIVENGIFGGTCLNVGCIPSKMFEYPAEIIDGLEGASALGVQGHIETIDWPAIRDRIFGRIDAIAASGRDYRQGDECPNIDVYEGTGRFVGPHEMRVGLAAGGEACLTADRFVLAAGSRPHIPDIPGLESVTVHTSDSIMRIDQVPARILVVGGGFIAAEFGHIFASLGAQVIQIVRGKRLLRGHDDEIAQRLLDVMATRYTVHTQTTISQLSPGTDPETITVTLDVDGTSQNIVVDQVLFATGRIPNSDLLGVEAAGIVIDADGYVVVDDYQQTTAHHIYALGDVCSHYQLKHVANRHARVIAHNLAHPSRPIASDHRYVPSAVFTYPQIASVGLTEAQARQGGIDYVVGRRDFAGVAAGWAREDQTGFCKILADPSTGLLLGAHIIGPEAATIIQPAISAMQFGIAAHDFARSQYWIHPALPEVLENALLEVPAPTGISHSA